jgi:hypothetical protein
MNEEEFYLLSKYADLEGSEWGEDVDYLLCCYINTERSLILSDEFKQAMKKEMLAQLEAFKEMFEIVSEEVTIARTEIRESLEEIYYE